MNKKILWVPWLVLCALFVWLIYYTFHQTASALHSGFGIWYLLVLVPVVVLTCLGLLIFAFVSKSSKSASNSVVRSSSHKAAFAIIALLELFIFGFCVWYILKG